MAATIIPKKSTVSGKIPDAASLTPGEIAINLTDGKLYAKHTDGSIVDLTGALELHTHSISQVSGLQSELNSKLEDAPTNGEQYVRQSGTWTQVDIPEGYTSTNFNSDFAAKDTDDLSEGTSNLYHTTARARSSISASGDLSYSSSTGVISFNETYSTASEIKAAYESNTNTNAYTDAEKTKLAGIESGAEVNVGTNLGQSRTTTSYTITSSTGTNTTLASATTSSAGVMSSADKSKLNGIETGAEVNTVDSVNGKTGVVSLSTTDISEGTNLYHTNSRARGAISVSGDLSYSSTTGVISFNETYSSATDLLTAIKTVDGSSSGLDADLLDGKHASAFATSAQGSLADSAVQPGDLATVATSGSYNDLTNKPDLSALEEMMVYSSQSAFPATGESGKVYIAEDTGYMYRWNGSGYTQLTDQTAIWGQVSGTLSDQTDLQSALNGKANTTTQVIAGTGLSGGGNLSANRTLSVNYGTTAGTAAQGNDSRLTNSREWTASVVSQAEAQAGSATTARKWTAQRVRQAIESWWSGSTDKTKLDGIATGATANATDAQLRARSSHTGTQAISTISGLNTALDGKVDTSDARLSDSRDWSATVVSQAEAQAGTSTTARKWTAQRVAQAISALGLKIGTTASTAKAGNWTPTWSEVSSKPTTFTPENHTHSLSEVTDAGNLAALNTNASTANFLRGDGTWVTPPNTNTTYSEISTAEIDAGTSSTRRTISGRRMQYALDKKADTVHGHSISDVTGLQAAIDSKANTSTQVIAGTGLSGGGTLAANRTLSVTYGTTAGTAAQGNDSRLSNSREWTASTVSQTEAQAGTATTRRAWTSQRVRQAITGWWNTSTFKTKLDSAVQPGDLAAVATSGSFNDLTNLPPIATVALSPTPPASASSGEFWFDTSDGSLNIFYDDGTSQQWVGVNGSDGEAEDSVPLILALG